MSCPHATTTTIAWLYGEADEAHALHVADCAACTAVADEHELVMSVVVPVLPRGKAPELPEAPAWRSPSWWAAGVLLAASALLALRIGTAPVSVSVPEPTSTATTVAALEVEPASVWSGELEAELDDLDASLDALAADFGTL